MAHPSAPHSDSCQVCGSSSPPPRHLSTFSCLSLGLSGLHSCFTRPPPGAEMSLGSLDTKPESCLGVQTPGPAAQLILLLGPSSSHSLCHVSPHPDLGALSSETRNAGCRHAPVTQTPPTVEGWGTATANPDQVSWNLRRIWKRVRYRGRQDRT